jgi:hypothetical protein
MGTSTRNYCTVVLTEVILLILFDLNCFDRIDLGTDGRFLLYILSAPSRLNFVPIY